MSKGKKMVLWTFALLAMLALIGVFALQWAIRTNGAAVLNTADRLIGGDRGVVMSEKANYGAASGQKLIVYGAKAPKSAQSPVIIFAHGGSWNWGDPDDYGFVARALVPEGFIVVLAGYRLHPEVEYPAMLEDTASVIAWTRSNIAEHGGDPERIILAGHSAGAYNVVMTALDRQWTERENLPGAAIAGAIGLSGPYDFYPFDSASTKASFGQAPKPKETQPINAVRGDAPPLLLIHGEKDTLVKPRNSRVLAEAISKAGGTAQTHFFAEMAHNEPLMALARPFSRDRRILDLMVAFAHEAASAKEAKASVPVQGETG